MPLSVASRFRWPCEPNKLACSRDPQILTRKAPHRSHLIIQSNANSSNISFLQSQNHKAKHKIYLKSVNCCHKFAKPLKSFKVQLFSSIFITLIVSASCLFTLAQQQPTNSSHSNNSNHHANHHFKHSNRIIRVRTSPQLNGRLIGPVRLLKANPEHVAAQQLRAQEESAATAAEFGLRATPPPPKRPELNLSSEEVQSELTNKGNCREGINSTPDVTPAVSLAASSPTLRLTKPSTPLSTVSVVGELEEEDEQHKQNVNHVTSGILTSAHGQHDNRLNTPSQNSGSILSLIDDYDSKIITNRTKSHLSCDSGEMVLRLNFSEPYKGIVYPDHNRLSPCRFFGDGHHNYELRLPLRGCGTRQAAPRVFINDIIVRFHKSLELEEDEVKTLICRYPPPLAPNPLDPTSRPEQEGMPPFELLADKLHNNSSIETLSESLLLLPSTGQQQVGSGTQIGSNNRLGPAGSGKLRDPLTGNSRDSYSSRNLLLNDQSADSPATNDHLLFDHIGSVELLFLGSSLLFLFLLLLALCLSYYCIKRRANHESSSRRASAILSRNRRYARSPLHAHLTPATGSLHRQVHQRHLSSQEGRHLGFLPQTAPSSPESDLSAQGLLVQPTAGKNSGLHYTGGHVNVAFAPDQYTSTPIMQTSNHKSLRGRKQPDSLYHNGTSVLGRRAQAGRHLQIPQVKGQSQVYTQTGPPLLSLATDWQRETYKPVSSAFGYTDELSPNQLLRAKSLSSVYRTGDQMTSQQHPAYLNLQDLLLKRGKNVSSNTTGRRDHLTSQNHSNYRRRQRRAGSEDNFLQSTGVQRHSLSRRKNLVSDSEDESCDCQLPNLEACGRNEHSPQVDSSKGVLRGKKRPKILLKSIEDSYITNLTEIHLQEYLKKDSTKPLSMSKWRSRQPEHFEDNSIEANETVNSSPNSEKQHECQQQQQHFSEDSQQDYYQSSAHTNLRSLTELDVHFAKQIHIDPSDSIRQTLGPVVSSDQFTVQDTRELDTLKSVEQNDDDVQLINGTNSNQFKKELGPNSGSEVLVKDNQVRKTLTEELNAIASNSNRQQSPDLILSPDYDYTRLQLESVPSHKSTSYV